MKSTLLTTSISLLLLPLTLTLAAPTPAPAADPRIGHCVCVTSPCPCDGTSTIDSGPSDSMLKVKTRTPPVAPPACTNDPDGGGCWDPTRAAVPLSRDWCLANPDECGVILGFGNGTEEKKKAKRDDEARVMKRAPMPLPLRPTDLLEWCLDSWELCTSGVGEW